MAGIDLEPSSSFSVSLELRSSFNCLTDLKTTNDRKVLENFINKILPFTEEAENKNYIIKRLTKGVTSTRKAARFPFANALWAFLATEQASDVSGDSIFQLLQKETELNKLLKMKTYPESEQAELLGCLAVCLTLAKVRNYVNLQVFSTLRQKFLNSNMEMKSIFFSLYDTFLFESLDLISKQDYKQSLWPAFSAVFQNLNEEMPSNVAIELFMLIRRLPKLLSQIMSVDRNTVESLDKFSLDNFILFNIGKVPFLYPSMSSFLKTFNVGSKMFENFWKSLLQRTETAAIKLTLLVFQKLSTDIDSEEQMKLLLSPKLLVLLDNVSSKRNDADETSDLLKNWVSNLNQDCRLPFLWHILQNCSNCPKVLASSVFQDFLTQEDAKNQRTLVRHIEEQLFSTNTKLQDVDTLVSFVSKFSSNLEKREQRSVKLRTLIDKILIRVSFTKVSNHKKSISGKTADVLFHAIRIRLLSTVGDLAQEIFSFVSTETKSASIAADLILSSDSTENYSYIKQLIAVLILDICIHNEVEEAYVAYLKSLLPDIRKIPQWVNNDEKAAKKKKKSPSGFEIDNAVLALIKLMNIPNKFYYNLANACFKSICEQRLQVFDENLIQRVLSVYEKLVKTGTNDGAFQKEVLQIEEDEAESSEDESSDEDSAAASEPSGEAAWEQEYFAKQETQVELNENLDDDQVAQLEEFDEMWELKMRSQKNPTFQVSSVNSVSNFFHLLDAFLKDSCDESILKSCFVFGVDTLAKNPKEEDFGVTFEMCSKILTLGEKKFIKTLKQMSSDESKDLILKIMKAMFCVSFSLKPKMYSTICKIVSTVLLNCSEDCTSSVLKSFRNYYFLPWVNHGKCLNVSHFLNALFQSDPSLFWLLMKKGSGQGKKIVLSGSVSVLKRINLVLTPRKLSQMKTAESDLPYLMTLCQAFLDAALSIKSLIQKQICIQTVHSLSKILNLKTSNSLLESSKVKLEVLKENVKQILDCFKSVDISQSCLNNLRCLASDFDIDVNTNEDLSYLRKRNTNSSRKLEKSGKEKKKRSDNTKDNVNDEEMQVNENCSVSQKKKMKRKKIDSNSETANEPLPDYLPLDNKRSKIERKWKSQTMIGSR